MNGPGAAITHHVPFPHAARRLCRAQAPTRRGARRGFVGVFSDYLVGNGIAAERLTAQGYGETRPAYSNATRDGRARNRRVELHVK